MKRFRFMYWHDSIMTDCYIRANNEQEALEKFKAISNEKNIIRFKEVKGEI